MFGVKVPGCVHLICYTLFASNPRLDGGCFVFASLLIMIRSLAVMPIVAGAITAQDL